MQPQVFDWDCSVYLWFARFPRVHRVELLEDFLVFGLDGLLLVDVVHLRLPATEHQDHGVWLDAWGQTTGRVAFNFLIFFGKTLACTWPAVSWMLKEPTFVFTVKKSLLPEASEWGDTCSRTHQDTRCLVVFGKLEGWCAKTMQWTKLIWRE